MKRVLIFIAIVLTMTGCKSTSHSELDYDGNSVNNIMTSGRILELDDGTIYTTNNENGKVFLYLLDNELNVLSKKETDLPDYEPGIYYLNKVDDIMFGYTYYDRDIISIELNESKEILKSKVLKNTEEDFGAHVEYIMVSNDRIYVMYKEMDQDIYHIDSFNMKMKDRKEVEGFLEKSSYITKGDIFRFHLRTLFKNDDKYFEWLRYEYDIHTIMKHEDFIYASIAGGEDSKYYYVRFKIEDDDSGMNIDKGDYEVIYETDASPMNFHGEKMIFSENEKMYIANLDGTEKVEIFDEVKPYTMMSEKIIFVVTTKDILVFDYKGNQIELFKK